MSSDGTALATGAGDRTVCLWNLEQERRLFQLPACDNAIAAVSFHPDNRRLAVVGFCNSLQIVDIATGQSTQRRDCACADLRTVTFSRDGTRMAVAGRNGPLQLWSITSAALERDIETDGRVVRALAFSPDGRWLASAGEGPVIRVSDVATGVEVMSLPARPAKVFALLFLDNQRLAAGGSDNRIHIWDLESRLAIHELVGHTGTVASLARDADANTLVSGSYDTTVRVWKLNDESAPAVATQPELPLVPTLRVGTQDHDAPRR
jgi:WD40 repeat protein